MTDDAFDPNTWVDWPEHEARIYLDDRAQTWVVVDALDYAYFSRWKWHVNKPHAKRNGRKRYAVRSVGRGGHYKPKLYLHVEIMKRAGVPPPSEGHVLVDHIDGDEFNCRKVNLRWATHKLNRMNINGSHCLEQEALL